MKPGYEFVRFAVLVIAILLVMWNPAIHAARPGNRRHHGSRMTCMSSSSSSSSLSSTPLFESSNKLPGVQRRKKLKNRRRNSNASDGQTPAAAATEGAFWLRNVCHDGFVVVKAQHRVLAQHEGLDKFDPEVKLTKETCVDRRTQQVMIRLYSPSQERYVCFNSKGRVRAVKLKRADRMGRLCAFYERPVQDPFMRISGGHDDASVYVNLQSAHDAKWFLGFGPNPRHRHGLKHHLGIVHTREGYRAILPRRMPMAGLTSKKRSRALKHRQHRGPPRGRRKHASQKKQLVQEQVQHRCDFMFAMGRHKSHDPEAKRRKEWSGLFDHLNGKFKGTTASKTKTATSVQEDSSVVSSSQSSAAVAAAVAAAADSAKNTHKISATTQSDVTMVPRSPLALKYAKRKRLVDKYLLLKYRKRPATNSYLYLHNRKIKVPKNEKSKRVFPPQTLKKKL